MSATDEVQQQSLLPPSEELIQNRIIWVADAYGPTQVERLIAGLRATGLDKERGNARASDFVLRLRAGPSASGYTRLRTIVPQGATGYFDVTRAELPTGALLALPTITVIHGSLTVLAVGFLLDRETGLAVDRALRAEYLTQLREVTARVISYESPMNLQRDAATAARKQLRGSLAAWIQERFLGAFGEQPAVELPAVELLTHRTDEALSFAMEREWPWSLNLEGWPLWRSTKWPDIYMIEGRDQEDDQYALRLRARESAILPTQGQAGEVLDEEAGWRQLAGRLNRSLEGTIPLWAATCLIRNYHSQLAAMRDIPPAVGIGPKETARRLTEAQRQLAIASDARAVAADIARWQGARYFAGYDGNDWENASPEPDPEGEGKAGHRPARQRASWIGQASRWCPESAKSVLDGEERVRQRLLVEAELLGAGAGLRVQRLTLIVAVLALIVAIAALGVAAVSLASTQSQPAATPRAPAKASSTHRGHRLT